MQTSPFSLNLSIVVPVYNEEESLPELEAWIDRVCKRESISYEVFLIDDGSDDTSWSVIESLSRKNENIRGLRFRRNQGKSAALNAGFERVQGEVVITMDADLQDSPDEIPGLMSKVLDDGYDLVSGWKQTRHDPLSKTIPSKFFNAVTRRISKIELNDFNCGLKAYRNEVVKSVDVYGEMHRYIPLLAKWAGFSKIGEKVVEHRARKYGVTKFGLERFLNGFLDLLTITFVGKFGKRPMHFFGLWGTIASVAGFGFLAYLSVAKLFGDAYRIAERPLFFAGILLLIVGTQLFVTGFLAELIIRSRPEKHSFKVSQDTAEESSVSGKVAVPSKMPLAK
ncbi:MAG: glycosyltransferase family 2 protein [Saprospiraceae bacterium]